MRWSNAAGKYGIIGQSLHWLIALGLIAAYVLAEAAESEDGRGLMDLHRSVGITILALAILRLVWRLVDRTPPWPATMAGYERVFARVTHGIFYVLLFSLPITGWLLSSAEGDPIQVFNFFELPPLRARGDDEALEELHEILFNVLVAFAVLHTVGALKHHFWNHDHVLRSMLPGRNRSARRSVSSKHR